jgi:hypothetical protein
MNQYYQSMSNIPDTNDDFDFPSTTQGYTDEFTLSNMQPNRHTRAQHTSKRARLGQRTAQYTEGDYMNPAFMHSPAEVPATSAQPYTSTSYYPSTPYSAPLPSTYSASAIPMAATNLASPEPTPTNEDDALEFGNTLESLCDPSHLSTFE